MRTHKNYFTARKKKCDLQNLTLKISHLNSLNLLEFERKSHLILSIDSQVMCSNYNNDFAYSSDEKNSNDGNYIANKISKNTASNIKNAGNYGNNIANNYSDHGNGINIANNHSDHGNGINVANNHSDHGNGKNVANNHSDHGNGKNVANDHGNYVYNDNSDSNDVNKVEFNDFLATKTPLCQLLSSVKYLHYKFDSSLIDFTHGQNFETVNFTRNDSVNSAHLRNIDSVNLTHSRNIDSENLSHARYIDSEILTPARYIDSEILTHARNIDSENLTHSRNIDSEILIHARNIDSDILTHARNIDSENLTHSRYIDSEILTHSRDIDSEILTPARNIDSEILTHSRNIDSENLTHLQMQNVSLPQSKLCHNDTRWTNRTTNLTLKDCQADAEKPTNGIIFWLLSVLCLKLTFLSGVRWPFISFFYKLTYIFLNLFQTTISRDKREKHLNTNHDRRNRGNKINKNDKKYKFKLIKNDKNDESQRLDCQNCHSTPNEINDRNVSQSNANRSQNDSEQKCQSNCQSPSKTLKTRTEKPQNDNFTLSNCHSRPNKPKNCQFEPKNSDKNLSQTLKTSNFGCQTKLSNFGCQTKLTNFGCQTKLTNFGCQTKLSNFGSQTKLSNFGSQTTLSNFGCQTKLSIFGCQTKWSNFGCQTKFLTLIFCLFFISSVSSSDLDKTDRFLDKINEQSIAAVFNKVAYGSTTKRSIPDNAYLYTTLATPLLTTYRYSDGNQEWYRVDVKEPEGKIQEEDVSEASFKEKEEYPVSRSREYEPGYGSDLEKDHALPTSAPAADILKNNNNKNYNNPNRYNNDRLRPDYVENPRKSDSEIVTEKYLPTSTSHSVLRNVRPTKSMFGKEVPSYVPPSRSFFTPPLPPEYLNPFADKPTLRGTNSESYQNRRPIPPPSLMPKKDRIPFRPDLPPINEDSPPEYDNKSERPLEKTMENKNPERKKTLNTPSQNVNFDKLGEFYGLNRLHNESNFEYEPMVLIPSISRILSGSNGRKEDIPDILLRTVTATPNIQRNNFENKPKIAPEPKNDPKNERNEPKFAETPRKEPPIAANITPKITDNTSLNKNPNFETKVQDAEKEPMIRQDTTTSTSDILNLPNVKEKNRVEVANATKTNSYEIWHICWNVHVYLVVFLYILLAIFSIVKLIRFERETHMFSKSYFLAIHLLLTVICVLRIFYLVYDPYNINNSFTNFMYDMLHNFPLSLLATTFAVLIVFLLKRTLNHLKVKTRPVFLVVFGLGHMFLCFCLNLCESFDLFGQQSFWSLVCRFIFILLCWSLGLSYVYLYKIIKNVLAKKSQNLSEICTQNISYASHITIAIALLFTLLGFVQLYGLFFIKIDRFTIPYHWILWGFELSVRLLEISIITLLAIVVSLRMSQREKQNVGFPLFPCTTSDSSTDNIYPNNCSTNLNALNYSLRSQNQFRQDLALENLPTDIVERPNLLKNSFQNDSFDKKSTLDRFQAVRSSANCLESDRSKYDRSSLEAERSENASDYERGVYDRGTNFERFERPNWGSQRFESEERFERDTFPVRNFEKTDEPNSGHFERSSGRTRTFERPERDEFPSGHFEHGSGRKKYYAKPKYDTDMYNNDDYQHDRNKVSDYQHERPKVKRPEMGLNPPSHLEDEPNVYSEPLDVNNEYERTRHDFERSDFERRSKNSWNNSGRRSIGRSGRKSNSCRPHMGVQTLPNQEMSNSMLVDENGFVRFRQLGGGEVEKPIRKHARPQNVPDSHYSDA